MALGARIKYGPGSFTYILLPSPTAIVQLQGEPSNRWLRTSYLSSLPFHSFKTSPLLS